MVKQKAALLARLYDELEQQIAAVHHHYDAALVTAHSRAVLDLARAIAVLEGKPEPERIDATTRRLTHAEGARLMGLDPNA